MKIFLKIAKFLIFPIIFTTFSGCGYEPLLGEKYGKYGIEKTVIQGDRRLGQILVNNLTFSKDKNSKLALTINSSKNREVSERTNTGKVKDYSIEVNFQIKATDTLTGDILIEKDFNDSQTYKASTLHTDTLNNEKKIVNNLATGIANQIMNEINLIQN